MIKKKSTTCISLRLVLVCKKTEEAGIEPAIANYATYGFEDRGSHQTPSASVRTIHKIGAFV